MKVLHIRLDAPGYSSDGIGNAFKENGYEYYYFSWQPYRFDNGLISVKQEMIRQAKSQKFDLILLHIQNSEVLDLDTAKSLAECGLVVNFSFDVRSKEKTQWMYDIAPHIWLTAFACQEDVDWCKSLGITNTMVLQSSCDTDLYKPLQLRPEIKKQYPEIVFIGNQNVGTNLHFEGAEERVEMVNFLKKEYGYRFGVYGLGWPGSKMVNPMEEINIYNSAKVVISQNQYKRTRYCSDRQWRAVACGALTACQYYPGIENDFFESELFSWNDFEELKEIINLYLENDEERKIVSTNQRNDFLRKGTWVHRIAQLKTQIEIVQLQTSNA